MLRSSGMYEARILHASRHAVDLAVMVHDEAHRPYIGIADGMPIARVCSCRHSKRPPLSEAVVLSAGTTIPARWACRRRCRDRAASRDAGLNLAVGVNDEEGRNALDLEHAVEAVLVRKRQAQPIAARRLYSDGLHSYT